MPKSKVIISLGVLVALLPVLGFPHAWESFFQVLIGFGIVLISVWSTIDKRLMLKAKAHRRQHMKRRSTDVEGRRLSDVEEQVVSLPITVEENV